jgi:hypothetical protein
MTDFQDHREVRRLSVKDDDDDEEEEEDRSSTATICTASTSGLDRVRVLRRIASQVRGLDCESV